MNPIPINPSAAFRARKHSPWQGIDPDCEIPAALHSPRGAGASVRKYGPGIGRAAGLLLGGSAKITLDSTRTVVSVSYPSGSGAGGSKQVSAVLDPAGWTFSGDVDGATGPYLLTLVCSLLEGPDRPLGYTQAAFRRLYFETQNPGNNSIFDLPRIRPAALEAVLRLSDAAYYDLTLELKAGYLQTGTPPPSIRMTEISLEQLLGVTSPARKSAPGGTALPRLLRLIRRGGVALMVGPPGTFKTESAKRAALESGAHLVVLKGSPGIEDRDFYGGVYPLESGPGWVDGPLTEAVILAAGGKTVLLIDEVLRFRAEYLNVLIGFLDSYSRPELERLGMTDLGSHQGRFYRLKLPNGETLAAPCEHLTVIMTTNLGDDHLQTSERLDAALNSRIGITLEVREADPERARALYLEVSGGHARMVEAALNLEAETRLDTESGDGLLIRPLDARKTVALLEETRALLEEGCPLETAFEAAVHSTVLAYCCGRDHAGALESAAVEKILDYARKALR